MYKLYENADHNVAKPFLLIAKYQQSYYHSRLYNHFKCIRKVSRMNLFDDVCTKQFVVTNIH